MNCIDFERIQSVMKFLDWKWEDTEAKRKSVPTVEELKSVAMFCMNKAFESGDSFKMGGFEAEAIEGIVSIKFVLDRANPLAELFN